MIVRGLPRGLHVRTSRLGLMGVNGKIKNLVARRQAHKKTLRHEGMDDERRQRNDMTGAWVASFELEARWFRGYTPFSVKAPAPLKLLIDVFVFLFCELFLIAT